MGQSEKAAWNVAPPVSGSGVIGNDGVARFATTALSARYKIPKGWKARFVDFKAIGFDMDVVFGGPAVTCTYGQVSTTPTAEEITFNAASGFPVTAGQKEGYYVPDSRDISHFAIAAAGAGAWAGYPSTNRRPDGTNPRL